MNCCNADGTCDQGKDCPIRKQRIQEVNDAYVKGYMMGQEDPLEDVIGSFKALMALLIFIVGLVMVAFAIWGRP